MNRPITLSTAIVAAMLAADVQALPSFPGAEGFGAITTGGRGGQVIKVTTLASSGPGSFQEALSTPGPRIIVFEVSGVISGNHLITHGDVTIAGQTAPGAGITIEGRLYADYSSSVQNIIIRHIRVRPPVDSSTPGQQIDAMQLSLNSRVMLDHVSVSWGVDETVDLYEADDVTVQWSTITESATSGHPEGQHNYGLINGPDGHRISVHHNLFAHHKNRNPAVANGPADVLNNVAYNVRHGFVHHNPASGHFNIIGNTYIQGPNDTLIPFWFDDENPSGGDPLYYMADNFIDDPGDFVGVVDNPWAEQTHPSFSDMYLDGSHYVSEPFDFSGAQTDFQPVTTQSSAEAMNLVLAHAGAFPRDVVTTRIVGEVESRSGSWGAHRPNDLLEGLTATAPPADSDGDGMPDDWESAHGLNPADGSDHGTVMPSGYTAIEVYINELADNLSGQGSVPPGGEGGSGPGTPSGSGGASSGGGAGNGSGGGSSAAGGDGAGRNPGAEPGGAQGGCSFGYLPYGFGEVGWIFALGLVPLAFRRRR